MYDLQTNSRMGLIGVHTPSFGQISNKYSGLVRNYKYMKVKTASVKIACASVLPADPLQVGVTAGKISPADLMNPILYRAVSNESWNTIVNRIYQPAWSGDAASGLDDALAYVTSPNLEKIYYSLLSGREWRKVMPQQGMSVKGLRPLVHQQLSVFGQQFDISQQYSQQPAQDLVAGTNASGAPITIDNANTVFRGRAIPMPAIPTVSVNFSGDAPAVDVTPQIPKTMVLAVVIPPMQLQQMYYRMIVSWDIVFFGLRPATEWDISLAQADGAYARYTRWSISASKELESDEDKEAAEVGCIDTLNMNPELVMES